METFLFRSTLRTASHGPQCFDTENQDTPCNPAMSSPIDHPLYNAAKQTVNNEELREDLLLHGDSLLPPLLPLPPFAGEKLRETRSRCSKFPVNLTEEYTR